jgi:hypothetical protein
MTGWQDDRQDDRQRILDEYMIDWGFTWYRLIKKAIRCANTIGAVITERNILTPLRLFIMTSPINKAVARGNGNRLFTEKQHIQIANNPQSPQCQTEPELLCPSWPPSFFTTSPSTLKAWNMLYAYFGKAQTEQHLFKWIFLFKQELFALCNVRIV